MAKEKKNKKVIFIVIAIILALGGGTFAGVYFYMNKNNGAQPIYIKEAFVEVGEVFVNLNDEDSKRYVKLNLSVSYDSSNKDLESELEEKKVVIRDVAIFYIKACKAKDFNPANEAILKSDLINKINQKLTSGVLKDIYISDIIVQ
ncbi:flagellar basal body-associated FliL family protein [Clostridium sp.]|uniref:flagellar basal body-associated FliL family protein n=1 Tax=Clostridium sp. TaxID=1506 RepID=UPI002605B794|nr:flagellar basal body-associated FliL family protein [Clostridium sp.]